jgi:hypothetical protein
MHNHYAHSRVINLYDRLAESIGAGPTYLVPSPHLSDEFPWLSTLSGISSTKRETSIVIT